MQERSGKTRDSGSHANLEFSAAELAIFSAHVFKQGAQLYRDLPWRRTQDPYAIWISEVMLQQTQVARVEGRWQRWLERFPTLEALAAASRADVLDEWQGMGYNRRALALWQAANEISQVGGRFPTTAQELVQLPSIGPATAAGICAFAYNQHGVYLETNVRTVFLHELFPNELQVKDTRLVPLVDATCPASAQEPTVFEGSPRQWYYALLDYGAYLKKTVPNPSRRSAGHVKQSKFEGSHRQKRAELLRLILAHEEGASFEELTRELNVFEQAAARDALEPAYVAALLEELQKDGFCYKKDNLWFT